MTLTPEETMDLRARFVAAMMARGQEAVVVARPLSAEVAAVASKLRACGLEQTVISTSQAPTEAPEEIDHGVVEEEVSQLAMDKELQQEVVEVEEEAGQEAVQEEHLDDATPMEEELEL